jgi:hypothetical protein
MFQMFHVFGHILQIFHLDVSKVDLGVTHVAMVIYVFQAHVLSVSSIFRRMLQMFYLDVLKVDLVLHVSFTLAHVAMGLVADVIAAFLAQRASPSPPFPYLPSVSLP